MNANLNANINQNKNRVNFQDNINNNTQTGFGFSPNYSYDEILELGVNFNWNYNRSKSSLRPDIITNFWIQTYSPYLVLDLPFGLKFNTDVEFNKRQQAYESETNLNTVIWNANISYKMLKSKKLIATVSAYDILNQNVGFYRTANSNFVTQNVYSTLKRYVLFSLTYQINNGPGREN
ncbi:MAG: outer membrane beta-barrel protein, partial [Bacteroidia bacterium]